MSKLLSTVWDTHADNFNMVKNLSATLDPAWSTLMEDLRERGMLESTLIVWMGEFGRTPKINATTGRDHFPLAWSTVLGGGGIKGGQVVGSTRGHRNQRPPRHDHRLLRHDVCGHRSQPGERKHLS